MESKVIGEKTKKAKKGKALLIRSLPSSVHRKLVKHQDSMTGRPTIDDAAIDLIIRGLNSSVIAQ